MITIKTSGKLYIAGEYQVLNTAGVALVFGIDRFIELSIEEDSKYSYQNGDNIEKEFVYEGKEVVFPNNNNNDIVKKSFEVIFEYLNSKKIMITPFKIVINTELENKNGKKYGFGSSSAIITGIIKIVAEFFKQDLSNDILFKLGVIAQSRADVLTSGGDLAAAIYGTTILYQRYDLNWVKKQKSFSKLIDKKWPKLKIIPFKTNMNFAAIWTKTSYKTEGLTTVIPKAKYRVAKKIVNKMFVSLIDNDYLSLKEQIKEYQSWLESILVEENLITPEISKTLNILNKYLLAGKVSGAGGGDSVIFLYPEGYNFMNLETELHENNLELIMIKDDTLWLVIEKMNMLNMH